MTDQPALDHLATLSSALALPMLTAAEVEAVLDLTRAVAHGSERRFAPLTAYMLGRGCPSHATAEQRLALLKRAQAHVEP